MQSACSTQVAGITVEASALAGTNRHKLTENKPSDKLLTAPGQEPRTRVQRKRQGLKKSPALSFRAPAWRRFRAPALLATVNARAQRDPARPSQRPASSNTMVPTLPARFAMLRPEHRAPAQHKPKTLNNELSNNSPSCLRSILASASSMQLKDSKRNSTATTPRQLKPQNRGTGARSRRSRGHLGRASWGRA